MIPSFSVRPLLGSLLLGGITIAPALANDALDVLEGRKSRDEVAVPPLPGAAPSSAAPTAPYEWPSSRLDPVWSRAVLFDDPNNPWVQQVALSGLYQWNAVWGNAEANRGNDTDLDGTRTRRARLGARLKAFHHTEIEAVGEFAGDKNHRGLERLKGTTRLPHDFQVTYGKMPPRFTTEYATDPQDALIGERSFLVNMVAPMSTLGFTVGQDKQAWDWSLGWFSSDNTSQLPGWEGDGFLLANLAYETGGTTGTGSSIATRWHLDYLYNFDGDRNGAIPRYQVAGRRSANGNQLIVNNPAYRHLLSTGVQMEQNHLSFAGDLIFAHGDSPAWGFSLTPAYWVIPGKLRFVGRYHFAGSDDAGGLVGGLGNSSDLQFDSSPVFLGDQYHSFYVGANLHLYKDEVVLMNGVERVILNDDKGAGRNMDAWILHSGLRASF